MSMMKFPFAIPAVLCIALIAGTAGCDRGSSQVGKYVNEKHHEDYTELKANQVCVVKQGKDTFDGKYSIEGNVITLQIAKFNAVKGNIQGNTITDNQGEHWIKQ